MKILEQLEQAIMEQKTISFDYKWEGIRIWNPHAIFSHISTGNVTVDIFQFDGYSSDKQKIPDWRPFLLKSISDVNILDEKFEIAEWYSSNSEKYNKAISKIK